MESLGELHFHRLLVPLDGSESAELALRAAVTVANRDRATLTLITVVPDMLAESSRWGWAAAQSPTALQEDADAEADKRLRDAIARIPEDIPVKTLIQRGKAGPAIVAHVNESTYDAVLMGARGVGRIGVAMLGSVSQYVMRHVSVPVFVAHAGREDDGSAS
jgi:nucleotide-binding universal stress UspA family protein